MSPPPAEGKLRPLMPGLSLLCPRGDGAPPFPRTSSSPSLHTLSVCVNSTYGGNPCGLLLLSVHSAAVPTSRCHPVVMGPHGHPGAPPHHGRCGSKVPKRPLGVGTRAGQGAVGSGGSEPACPGFPGFATSPPELAVNARREKSPERATVVPRWHLTGRSLPSPYH